MTVCNIFYYSPTVPTEQSKVPFRQPPLSHQKPVRKTDVTNDELRLYQGNNIIESKICQQIIHLVYSGIYTHIIYIGDFMTEKTKQKLIVYGISIFIAELVGGLSALLTIGGMKKFATVIKPELTPPAAVFPIVWTILFALMGISAALIYTAPKSIDRTHGIIIYVLQLIVNFFWSIIFFNFQAYGFAFFWLILLWVLIVLMIYKFYKVRPLAGILQAPYLIWVTFAGYLTYNIWMLNK